MSTATTTKAKDIPAQANVTIVGGKTQVKLRAYGDSTLKRYAALLTELSTNAATHADVIKAVRTSRDALAQLNIALAFNGLPTTEAGDEEAE